MTIKSERARRFNQTMRPYGRSGTGWITEHKRTLKTTLLTVLALGFIAALASAFMV